MTIRPASTLLLFSVWIAAIAAACRGEQPARPRGPDELPNQLPGTWHVGLLIDGAHCWLRFENPETGEVHTLSRFFRGFGGRRDQRTGEWIAPPVAASGVYFDQDLHREANGEGDLMRTAIVADPVIYRGLDRGFGYGAANNNCVTFVRDGWEYYTGERFGLLLHLPTDLKHGILLWRRRARQQAEQRESGE